MDGWLDGLRTKKQARQSDGRQASVANKIFTSRIIVRRKWKKEVEVKKNRDPSIRAERGR